MGGCKVMWGRKEGVSSDVPIPRDCLWGVLPGSRAQDPSLDWVRPGDLRTVLAAPAPRRQMLGPCGLCQCWALSLERPLNPPPAPRFLLEHPGGRGGYGAQDGRKQCPKPVPQPGLWEPCVPLRAASVPSTEMAQVQSGVPLSCCIFPRGGAGRRGPGLSLLPLCPGMWWLSVSVY